MLHRIREFWAGWVIGRTGGQWPLALKLVAEDIAAHVVVERDQGRLRPAAFPLLAQGTVGDFRVAIVVDYADPENIEGPQTPAS